MTDPAASDIDYNARILDAVECTMLAVDELHRDLQDVITLLAVIAGTDRYGRPLPDLEDDDS